MKHYFKHLGHFNKVKDIRNLRTKSADEIVIASLMTTDYSFHKVPYDKDSDFCLEDEFEGIGPWPDFMRDSTGDYVILNEPKNWDAWDDEYKDKADDDDADCYIDVFLLYKIVENGKVFMREF